MVRVEGFINELMSSNCYVIYDDVAKRCIVVDPASEKCLNEIEFIENHGLKVDYIILTHEHTDHTWGCNTLIDLYNAKLICSEACKKALPKEGRAYFLFYYDNPDYQYSVKRVDATVEEMGMKLDWCGHGIRFISTPGHSKGSICFSMDNNLFTGDTLMLYKPFINKKSGSIEEYQESLRKIFSLYDDTCQVYPGHGDIFLLKQAKEKK